MFEAVDDSIVKSKLTAEDFIKTSEAIKIRSG